MPYEQLSKKLGNVNWRAVFSKYDLNFLVLFFGISILFYSSIMNEGPLNTHVWRQADCLSITKKYYEGAPFLEPQMHLLFGDEKTSGRSAGEFPILYYSVAQIWKVFGVSYFAFRLFYFIILFFGIFAFYKSVRIVFENEFWAIILSLLLFSSPVLAVYGISFLTDGPAFSINLIALYFLTRFAQKNKSSFFYYAMLFFALAGLIKVSALIIFVFIGFIFLLERFPIKTLGSKKLFPKWQFAGGFALVILSIFSWYTYAHFYNEASGFKYTFNNIYPIWKMKSANEMTLLNDIKDFSSHVFYSRPMILVFFFLLFYNLTLYKKIPLFAYLASIIISIGVITYFIFWAPLMGVHDYYFISILVIFLGTILPFAYYLKTNQAQLFAGKQTKNALLVFFSFNFLICFSTVKLKTTARKGSYVVLDSVLVNRLKWYNEDNIRWRNWKAISGTFDALAIRKEDKVICLSDFSFNASLFLMDRNGWTNFLHYSSADQIEELVKKGAKYLFIQEKDLKNKPFLESFTKVQISKYKDILVFKL